MIERQRLPSDDNRITKFLDWIGSWYNEYWAWGFCIFACFVFPGLMWYLGFLG